MNVSQLVAMFLKLWGVENLLKRIHRREAAHAKAQAEENEITEKLDAAKSEAEAAEDTDNPLKTRGIPLFLMVLAVSLISIAEFVPSRMTSEVFMADETITTGLTLFILAILVLGATLVPSLAGAARRFGVGAIVVGLLAIGFLRARFLIVVSPDNDPLAIAVQVLALLLLTTVALLASAAIMSHSETVRMFVTRAKVDWLEGQRMQAERRRKQIHEDLEASKAEYRAKATAFIGKQGTDDQTRLAFMRRIEQDMKPAQAEPSAQNEPPALAPVA